MNCPKCKNPIEDNAIDCEWCGSIIKAETGNEVENFSSSSLRIDDSMRRSFHKMNSIELEEYLENMNRTELKEYIKKVNLYGITVKKSMTDDDIRRTIRDDKSKYINGKSCLGICIFILILITVFVAIMSLQH
jgi:hypothetical protein